MGFHDRSRWHEKTRPVFAEIYDQAKQQLNIALAAQRENTITFEETQFVCVELNGKFEFVDFSRVNSGTVPSITGEMIKLCDMNMLEGNGTIQASTLEYCVDQACTTPESYLCSLGDDTIWIRVSSYDDGWVAVTLDKLDWKWFPFCCCVP